VSVGRQRRYFCPVDVTLSVIDGKWKPLILCKLGAPRRFGALQRALPRVSHKVLTQQLREGAGLVRRLQSQNGKNVTYEMTEFGRTLKPSLTALASWGRKNHKAIGVELEWR
jgi:DNA-binding HxlR family transcriptional regulator